METPPAPSKGENLGDEYPIVLCVVYSVQQCIEWIFVVVLRGEQRAEAVRHTYPARRSCHVDVCSV